MEMKMKKLIDMSEAHLLNVQREITSLEQRKVEIDSEISKLTEYLREGVDTVTQAKSEANAALAEPQSTPEI